MKHTLLEQVREAKGLADEGNLSTRKTQEILGAMLEHLEAEEKARQTAIDARVKTAVDSLSYSELQAMIEVALRTKEDKVHLIAGDVADQMDISRSVIVNALRKLESAGVIEARSMGMKGTYVRFLVPALKTRLPAA